MANNPERNTSHGMIVSIGGRMIYYGETDRLPLVRQKAPEPIATTPETLATRFADESTHAARALQAYLILISCASNEQHILCRRLAGQMNYDEGGNLGPVLAPIMRWCKRRGFPSLTALVDDESGNQGDGTNTVSYNDCAAETRAVFAFRWFEVFPPTLQELTELSSTGLVVAPAGRGF